MTRRLSMEMSTGSDTWPWKDAVRAVPFGESVDAADRRPLITSQDPYRRYPGRLAVAMRADWRGRYAETAMSFKS
ncbi:hypothetical protein NliqN6_3450 [Naganishia liquefaciens]|uniref:Uncharacterized protein n=1 Tax=Naganishia liquefaciens TaxID=104408 RepID=A0A8H3TUC2_9TREE|nr:hypothetical protein NliqN6_3450 [Naganishia liquefaciens]